MIAAAWTVYLKELVDALRDRRTLFMVLISSVAQSALLTCRARLRALELCRCCI